MLCVFVAVFLLKLHDSSVEGVKLLLAADHAVLLVDTENRQGMSLAVERPRTPHSVDYHYNRGYLYYAVHDEYGKNSYLKRRNILFNSQDKTLDIAFSGLIDEVAVDCIQDRIYWMSTTNANIQVADLNGNNPRTIISQQKLLREIPSLSDKVQLYDLIVDPYSKVLFMVADETTTSSSRSFLVSSDLQGNSLKLNQNINLPILPKLMADVRKKMLYVYGTQDNTVKVFNYNGDGSINSNVLTLSVRMSDKIRVFGNNIYWVDRLRRPESIYGVNLNFGLTTSREVARQQIFASNLSYIYDFKVYDRLLQTNIDQVILYDCDRKGCSHTCEVKDAPVCTCTENQVLGNDGKTCQGEDGVKLLLSSNHVVIFLDPATKQTEILSIDGPRTPHSLDYHYKRGYLFYAVHDDSGRNTSIKRRNILFNSQEKILDIQFAGVIDELAVDWIQNRIYWMNRNNANIQMADINFGDIRTIISRQDLLREIPGLSDNVQLYDIIVDPYSKLLFMVADETTTSHSRSFLVTSNLNGKQLRLNQNLNLPILPKVTADVLQKRLYIYGTQDKILKIYNYADESSSGSEISTISTRLSDRIRAYEEIVYWVDPLIGPENIYRVNYRNSKSNIIDQELIYTSHLSYINDFKVYNPLTQTNKDSCAIQKTAVCTCPQNQELDIDGKTCRARPSCPGCSEKEDNKTCKLPYYSHTTYTYYNCPTCEYSSGDSVPHSQLIVVSCNSDYQLVQGLHVISSKSYIACQHGVFEPPIPLCSKLCPSLTSLTMDLECWQGADIVRCDQPMLPNTTVKYSCKEYHEASFTNQPSGIKCGPSGLWSRDLPQCIPKCGLSNLNSFEIKPTIVDGKPSQAGNFPWHAGIYHKKANRWEAACGGTLITSRAILTAAHCVTQKCLTCKSPEMSKEDLMVALGKTNRNWNTLENSEAKRSVKSVIIHPNYVGSSLNYGQDIALLILETEVPINIYVMPACVDYQKKHVAKVLAGNDGYVAGWGNTEECGIQGTICDKASTTLQYALTNVIDFNKCYNATQSIKGFPVSRLSSDKYCAGNGSASVIQQGDSGGGLTFVFDGVHYVFGVVSVKLKLELENKLLYSFGAFTSVPVYLDWLSSKLY